LGVRFGGSPRAYGLTKCPRVQVAGAGGRKAKGRDWMRYHRPGWVIGGALLAIAAFTIAGIIDAPAQAKEPQSYLDNAQGYVAKGNFRAAEIELRNAAREAPQDAHVHALLAQVYLRLGDVKAAEREARSARDLKGEEADYLLPLANALLALGKFVVIHAS